MPRYWTKKEDQYLLDNWFESMTVLAKKDSYSEKDEKFWIKRIRDLGYAEKLFLKYQ